MVWSRGLNEGHILKGNCEINTWVSTIRDSCRISVDSVAKKNEMLVNCFVYELGRLNLVLC